MCPAQEGQAGITVPWLLNGLWKQEGGFSPQDIFNLVISFTAFNSLSYILITQCREINPNSPFVLIILNLYVFAQVGLCSSGNSPALPLPAHGNVPIELDNCVHLTAFPLGCLLVL